MINVAVLGASGYSGNELVSILHAHPEVNLKFIQSKNNIEKKVTELYPDSIVDLVYSAPSIDELNRMDVVFLALPKEESSLIASKLSPVVIDLSPAHRFDNNYVYGLPEKNREKIKLSNKIANPGCYATAAILGILPLDKGNIKAIAFDCKSGYSGGGKTKKYDFAENVVPYSLSDHYQKPEISKFLNVPFSFVPHVVNSFRGLIATIHIFGNFDDLQSTYMKFYKKEPLVKISDTIPDFKSVTLSPYCKIGGFSKEKDHHVIISAIDNLLKGAASQAVQNMNIRFGFDEKTGLDVEVNLS
ncbi:MAG: N-acetyl-gamma-glutamyl-phosphate reductase [Candidatus Micrarchaeota archaeon]